MRSIKISTVTSFGNGTPEKVQIKLVVKNEELPLKAINHCATMFSQIKTAIETATQWQLIESYTGEEP